MGKVFILILARNSKTNSLITFLVKISGSWVAKNRVHINHLSATAFRNKKERENGFPG